MRSAVGGQLQDITTGHKVQSWQWPGADGLQGEVKMCCMDLVGLAEAGAGLQGSAGRCVLSPLITAAQRASIGFLASFCASPIYQCVLRST